ALGDAPAQMGPGHVPNGSGRLHRIRADAALDVLPGRYSSAVHTFARRRAARSGDAGAGTHGRGAGRIMAPLGPLSVVPCSGWHPMDDRGQPPFLLRSLASL